MAESYKVSQGTPLPMGATWDGGGTNFSIFSENATAVELCLFDERGERELARVKLPEYTDGIWHGRVEGVAPGSVYGYRVHGAYRPLEGHRFNPNKLLLDPYAMAHTGELVWGPEIFGYVMETKDDTTFDTRDSAPYVPKCLVTDPARSARDSSEMPGTSRVPWHDTILYELHVKGYTKLHPALPEALRGTYAGLGHPEIVRYIQSLGVTAIELLPIHTFLDESHLHDLHLSNFWGYNSIGFFAPDTRYAAEPQNALREFKAMVAQYHDAGVEVVLDVVYNHTAEGSELGPTLSFKGIDNASYYRLQAGKPRYYVNDTGTGNTVNASHPRVLQLICDSLRYWVEVGHVDGFRFDLGTILARNSDGFDQGAAFLKIVGQDPILSGVKLIAEPWDIGPGGYRVGEFPPGWMEWNDKFRDRCRGFWTGGGSAADLVDALRGSPSIFNKRGRRPWASINFVTAHDGFTLNDVVSYTAKHNLANGEDNRDGSNNNLSSNGGVEGPTADVTVQASREQQMRNLLSCLLLAQGTPMLLAGDEFGRTQQGNNNAYCQDNAISWVDWTQLTRGASVFDFTRTLIALRRAYPLLHNSSYFRATDSTAFEAGNSGCSSDGPVVSLLEHSTGCFGMLLSGCALPCTSEKCLPTHGPLLLMVNGEQQSVCVPLPEQPAGRWWVPLVDTAASGGHLPLPSLMYNMQARSISLLASKTSDAA